MKIASFVKLLFILFFTGVLFNACNKNETPQANVVIAGISPDSGPYSTIVTITGSGFSATATNNAVKFNGKDAVVQTASATQLVVVVPRAAGTGTVTVQNGSKTAAGPDFNFTYTISVNTLAGSSTEGFADGNGSVAQFNYPKGVAVDAAGNIYVADEHNYRIRKITSAGEVSTLAGTGIAGFADGDGGAAQFNDPGGITIDKDGNIYVADNSNNRIRKITASGTVSTFAGSGSAGFADGNGNLAMFDDPNSVTTDVQGNVYVADKNNQRIRKITPSGVVSTLAGNGNSGFADGDGATAQFNGPAGVTSDAQGNIYVADFNNNRLRKVTASGMVTTFAGNGVEGYADGAGSTAQFDHPASIICDALGNIYVGDYYNYRIRLITAAGNVSVLAGNGSSGFVDGNASIAEFAAPSGITADTQGNIYVADKNNHRIRKIIIE